MFLLTTYEFNNKRRLYISRIDSFTLNISQTDYYKPNKHIKNNLDHYCSSFISIMPNQAYLFFNIKISLIIAALRNIR